MLSPVVYLALAPKAQGQVDPSCVLSFQEVGPVFWFSLSLSLSVSRSLSVSLFLSLSVSVCLCLSVCLSVLISVPSPPHPPPPPLSPSLSLSLSRVPMNNWSCHVDSTERAVTLMNLHCPLHPIPLHFSQLCSVFRNKASGRTWQQKHCAFRHLQFMSMTDEGTTMIMTLKDNFFFHAVYLLRHKLSPSNLQAHAASVKYKNHV